MRREEAEGSIDTVLRALGQAPVTLPPLSGELESELGRLRPRPPASRLRGFVVVIILSMLYGIFISWSFEVRPDLSALPRLWLITYCAAWLTSFLAIAWLAVVPRPGDIMPNWRFAGIGAVVAASGFVLSGLLFARAVPGLSMVFEPTLQNLIDFGKSCLTWGMITAIVPVILGALLLRGRVPVGSRWAGAGLGAAGGSLGGLMLHLHCYVADALHLGVIHGGVVLLSALAGAVLIPPTVGR